jgi:hypothetical protein
MGKSKKPAQTPRDKEREYEALYRSVGLSSEEEGDSNESDSDDEVGRDWSSEEGPTTPKRGKGKTTAESPQQRDGGSKGKRVASKQPDPLSSVPYATGMAASMVSTPWNKKGTSPVEDQTSKFGKGEYPPLPTRVVAMEIDPVTLRPAAKTRSEHAQAPQEWISAINRTFHQVHRPAHVLPQPLRPSIQRIPQRTLMRGPVAE